jgi:hypothetical protein
MVDPVSSPQPSAPASSPREAAATLPVVRSAARWFWWIAGLSLVNIVMFQSGSQTSFVMGLGITTVSDVVYAGNKVVGFVIDAIALGFFVWVGFQAQSAKLWAFYLGVTVYVLDALIYAYVQDWMPVAFHGLAIFFIVKGILALQGAAKATE